MRASQCTQFPYYIVFEQLAIVKAKAFRMFYCAIFAKSMRIYTKNIGPEKAKSIQTLPELKYASRLFYCRSYSPDYATNSKWLAWQPFMPAMSYFNPQKTTHKTHNLL
jgi:hypothetical protein